MIVAYHRIFTFVVLDIIKISIAIRILIVYIIEIHSNYSDRPL
jgi:hypothetical protein